MGRILLTGNCCLDIVTYLDVYPAEDSDNRGVKQMTTLGGNVTNSLKVASQLNNHSQLFSAIPNNHPVFENFFKHYRIDTSSCVRRDLGIEFPLTIVLVNTSNGSRTLLNSGGGNEWPKAEEFISAFPNFDQFSWLHFESELLSYGEVVRMVKYARNVIGQGSRKTTISLEIEHLPARSILEEVVPLVDVIIISKDIALMNGWADMTDAVHSFQCHMNARHATVVCPWAEKGAAARGPIVSDQSNAPVIKVPGHHPSSGRVIDTLAAGDCFIGALVHFLNERKFSLEEVLEKATFIAGESVGQIGLMDLKLS